MKVLLATNVQQLDETISSEKNIELVSKPVYYLEAIIPIAAQHKPDVIVITSWLDGNTDITEVIYELRLMEIRVVFIAGNLTVESEVIQKICKYGVYDILFGEVSVEQIINKIFNPTPLSEGLALIINKHDITIDDQEPLHKPQRPLGILKSKHPPAKETFKTGTPALDKSVLKIASLLLLTGNSADTIYSLVRNKIKKPLAIIDADRNSTLAVKLGLDTSRMWKHDWRTGLSAEPAVINKKVLYYGMDKEMNENLDDRDIRCLREIILAQAKQNRQVVLNAGTRKDLLPYLSDLNFKIINL